MLSDRKFYGYRVCSYADKPHFILTNRFLIFELLNYFLLCFYKLLRRLNCIEFPENLKSRGKILEIIMKKGQFWKLIKNTHRLRTGYISHTMGTKSTNVRVLLALDIFTILANSSWVIWVWINVSNHVASRPLEVSEMFLTVINDVSFLLIVWWWMAFPSK